MKPVKFAEDLKLKRKYLNLKLKKFMNFIYIDPGSGSILFQVLIAGLLGILTFFKNIKLFVLSIFKKNKTGNSKDEEGV